jgi:cell wall-associated NlpC family hydrolase
VEHNVRSSSNDLAVFRDGASEHGSPGRVRERIVDIARNEIGVREATGNNDGVRVEEYLAHTGLGKGHAWCAAFVSWCYGQAGLPAPRSAWSPALFPVARSYTKGQEQRRAVQPADLFAIYSRKLRRIDHVGIVQKMEGDWIKTVEGNVGNRVLSKRRPLATIYAFSNWLD